MKPWKKGPALTSEFLKQLVNFAGKERKSWKLIMLAFGTEREWRKGMGHREVLTNGQQTLKGSSCV